MKKVILKVFGVAALAAGMMYNVQVFSSENGPDISLATLGNVAIANNEGGNGDCPPWGSETCNWQENDNPWWCFWCPDGQYEGSDPDSYWKEINWTCSVYVTDCVPGTGTCTPGYSPDAC